MTTNAKQDEKPEGNRLKTPPFRVSFPQVFVPKAIMPGADLKYSISMLFPKVYTADWLGPLAEIITVAECNKRMAALKNAVSAAAVTKWGADKSTWPTRKVTLDNGEIRTVTAITSPWHDGTEKDYDGYDATVIYASASSKIRPGLVDAKSQAIMSVEEFKGGDYAWASLTVFAYDNKKLGVSFGLRNIQKLRDGEPFGGGVRAEDEFTAIDVPAAEEPAGTVAGDGLGI